MEKILKLDSDCDQARFPSFVTVIPFQIRNVTHHSHGAHLRQQHKGVGCSSPSNTGGAGCLPRPEPDTNRKRAENCGNAATRAQRGCKLA
jgi:hypothetical protein